MDNNNWRPIQGGEPTMATTDWRNQLQPDSRQRIVNKIMDELGEYFSCQGGLHELKKLAEGFEEKVYTAATSQSDYLRKISQPIDWRNQLQPDSRQRIVNKIMGTLKNHLPFSGQEGLHELKKIAERFEEKIYTAATSQSDYLRKISLKMLTMETKSQSNIPNALPSDPVGNSNKAPDPGSLGMLPRVHNQANLSAKKGGAEPFSIRKKKKKTRRAEPQPSVGSRCT